MYLTRLPSSSGPSAAPSLIPTNDRRKSYKLSSSFCTTTAMTTLKILIEWVSSWCVFSRTRLTFQTLLALPTRVFVFTLFMFKYVIVSPGSRSGCCLGGDDGSFSMNLRNQYRPRSALTRLLVCTYEHDCSRRYSVSVSVSVTGSSGDPGHW